MATILPLQPTSDDNRWFEASTKRGYPITESLHQRILMERAVIRCAVAALIQHGFYVKLYDCDDHQALSDEASSEDSIFKIMDELLSCDDEYLRVYRKEGDKSRFFGWIHFVYGNDGYDVISDNTVNLEEFIKPASDLADQLADAMHPPGQTMEEAERKMGC